MEQVTSLPLDAIKPNPRQPRRRFDEAELEALAASLRDHGVLQPVLVRPLAEGAYELIAGERRWQAARRAGLTTLPCLVLAASSRRALELALVENVQRVDLTPLEQADAYRHLMATLGLTQERLATRIGISRAAVANRLRLLDLASAAHLALDAGRITEGHARALLSLPREQQDRAVSMIEAGQLSVRQTERLVKRLAAQPRTRGAEPDFVAEELAETLRHALGARVKVRRSGGGVHVLLHFHSLDAARSLVDALLPAGDAGGLDEF